MPELINPILPGFNPDPCVCRVGSDVWIVTSTFEWYPGLSIYHSKEDDLANWKLISRPLNGKRFLDLRGEPDSCGVWAPALRYSDTESKFYMVFSDVKRKDGSFKDVHNYIITASKITGPWSDPVYINSSGFDPSIYIEGEKKWFLNMLWDHTRRPRAFAGIRVQEYNSDAGRLIGERKTVYHGSKLDLVEGPHMYKRNDYYYLMTAEGGTGYDHAVTLCRSKSIWGPFEEHPDTHIITTKDSPLNPLQRAGHGSILETSDGRTYVVHLTGRPITQKRRCVLGRETAIQEAYWKDDWLYIKNGPVASLRVNVPGTRDESKYWAEQRYTFEKDLHIDFQWLRTPEHERIFKLKNGKLALIGRESIGSWFEQALVARRQTHFSYDAETVLDFSPEDERQFAGLTAYYCRYNFFYLTVTADASGQRELLFQTSQASFPFGNLELPFIEPVQIPSKGKVKLALSIRNAKLQFSYALEGEELKEIGPVFDASILSDECGGHPEHGSFTGAFVGMAASDLNGTALAATFDYFLYRPEHDVLDRYDV